MDHRSSRGLAALAGCQQKGRGTAAPAATSPPVATVDGQPIDRDLFEFYVKGVAGKPSSELIAEQRDQALDNLVRARVIAEQAEKDGTAEGDGHGGACWSCRGSTCCSRRCPRNT